MHWNLFPVADVNSNPDNPIIGTRAFGANPDQVGDLVAAYIRGARANGMLTTAKHFHLKGRILLYRRGGTISRAVDCFERAVRLDPHYAAAWAGLGDACSALGYYGLAPAQACMPRGTEAARRAVTLNPSLAEAHAALAMAALMGTWDKAEAEREFLRALELNPRLTHACGCYALYYLSTSEGRHSDAVAQAKLALEYDPLSSYAHTVYGFVCGSAGKSVEAVQANRRAVDLDPESYIAHHTLQIALYYSRRFEEAVAVGERALAMSGRHPLSVAALAETFAEWGKPADAEALYAEMLARARRQYISPGLLSWAAAAAMRDDESVCHARNAFETHDPMCLWFSKHWPATARLYANPRLRELLSQVGFGAGCKLLHSSFENRAKIPGQIDS